MIDTWWKSGRILGPGERAVTIRENREWIENRIARGDRFAIATDPDSLPKPIPSSYVAGEPNGYFTALELSWLRARGINPDDWSKLLDWD